MGWIAFGLVTVGVLVVVLVCLLGVDRISQLAKCPECPPPAKQIEYVPVSPVKIPVNHPKFSYSGPKGEYGLDDRVTDVTSIVVPDNAVPCNHIPIIIYINMKQSKERNKQTQDEIRRWGIKARVFRFEAIEDTNKSLGCFQSHVHCVGWAARQGQNVLILEDDFVLDVTRSELFEYLDSADISVANRWDVIQLAQYVHKWQKTAIQSPRPVFRLLHSTTASGYLVNKHYAKDFLQKWSYDLEARMHLETFQTEDHCDQVHIIYQQEDTWLGFNRSLGSQRAGNSIIGGVFAHNTWRCSKEYDKWYGSDNLEHTLYLSPAPKQQRVAVLLTPDRQSYIPKMWREAFKHNVLEFHVVFSGDDQVDPQFNEKYVIYHSTPIDKQYFIQNFDKVFFIDSELPSEYGLLRGGDVAGFGV